MVLVQLCSENSLQLSWTATNDYHFSVHFCDWIPTCVFYHWHVSFCWQSSVWNWLFKWSLEKSHRSSNRWSMHPWFLWTCYCQSMPLARKHRTWIRHSFPQFWMPSHWIYGCRRIEIKSLQPRFHEPMGRRPLRGFWNLDLERRLSWHG